MMFFHRAHAQNEASEVDVIGSAAVDVRLLPVHQNDERRLQTRRDGHVEKGFIAEGDAVAMLQLLARHGRYIPCGSRPADSDACAQRDTHQGGGAQPQAPRQHQPRQGQHGEQHPSRRMQQARNRAPAPCRHQPGRQRTGRQHDTDQPLGPNASAAAPQANGTQRRHAGSTSSTARAAASNLPPGIPCLPKDPAAWVRSAAGFAPRPVRPSAVRCRTDQGTGSA